MKENQATSSNLAVEAQFRDQNLSPIGIDPERILRKSQSSEISISPMTSSEVSEIMAATHATYIWNKDPTILMSDPLPNKKENGVDMPVTVADD